MHQQKFSDALANFNPLRSPLFCLCAIASASMQVGDATGAFLMRHTALPRNGGAMQNAAGNPIRKKVPAFSVLPKIYFPPILLALTDISDNLSRILRHALGLLNGVLGACVCAACVCLPVSTRAMPPQPRQPCRRAPGCVLAPLGNRQIAVGGESIAMHPAAPSGLG